MTHMEAQFPMSQPFCLTNTHRQTVKNPDMSCHKSSHVRRKKLDVWIVK